MTISTNNIKAATSIFILIPNISSKTHKYALNPSNANADLNIVVAHKPTPRTVPI